MRVYVDGVMLLNFLVDYLLLLGTNRLSGHPSDSRRLLASAVLGAVYSGACLLPGFRFLGNHLWRIVILLLMGSIAFGWSRSALRRCGVFLMLSFALGGLAVCVGRADFRALALAGAGLWCLCRASFGMVAGGREYVPLEIAHGGRTVKLLALRDTGNTLRDPITGHSALVLSAGAASRLTGLTPEQLRHPLETMAAAPVSGLRLLPYRTVGQGSGMMLAMMFEDVIIDGRRSRKLVAFAPENFGGEGQYQALTGGTISC